MGFLTDFVFEYQKGGSGVFLSSCVKKIVGRASCMVDRSFLVIFRVFVIKVFLELIKMINQYAGASFL